MEPQAARDQFSSDLVDDDFLISIMADLMVGVDHNRIDVTDELLRLISVLQATANDLKETRGILLSDRDFYYELWLKGKNSIEARQQLDYERLLRAASARDRQYDSDGTDTQTVMDERELGKLRRYYHDQVRDAVLKGLPVPDSVLDEFTETTWAKEELEKRKFFREYSWVLDLAKEAENPEDLKDLINFRLHQDGDDDTIDTRFLDDAFKLGNAENSEQYYVNSFTDRMLSNQGLMEILQDISDSRGSFHGLGLPRSIWPAIDRLENGTLSGLDLDTLRTAITRDLRKVSRAYYTGMGNQDAVSQFRSEDLTLPADESIAEISIKDRIKIASMIPDRELRNKIRSGTLRFSELLNYQRYYENQIEQILQGQRTTDRRISKLQESEAEHKEVVRTQRFAISHLERQVKAYERNIASLTKKLGKKDHTIENLESTIKEIREKRDALLKDIREKRDQQIQDISQTYQERLRKLRQQKNQQMAEQRAELIAQQRARDALRQQRERMKQLFKMISKKVSPGTMDYGLGKKLEIIVSLFSDKLTNELGNTDRVDALMKVLSGLQKKKLEDIREAVEGLEDLRLDEFTEDQLTSVYDSLEYYKNVARKQYRDKQWWKKFNRQEIIRQIISEILHGDPVPLFEAIGSKETRKAQKSSVGYKVKAASLRPTRMINMLGGPVMNEWFVEQVNQVTDREILEWHRRHEAGMKKLKELDLTDKKLSRQISFDGHTFSADEVIHIAIGMRNFKSAAAIVYGNMIEEHVITGLTKQLTDEELQWGQFMLDDFEQNYDRLNQAFIIDKNIDMGKEVAYFPMMRQDLEQNPIGIGEEIGKQWAVRNAWRKGYAKKNFTKDRIIMADEHQVPIRLGATAIWLEQIDKQEHYIAAQELIKDLQYIQNDQVVRDALKEKFGSEATKWLQKYVNDFADPSLYKTYGTGARVSRLLRNNMAVAYLAFNMLTVLKQAPSLAFYLRDAGVGHIMSASFQMISHPERTIKDVESKDPQMLDRSYNRMMEELKQTDSNPYVEGVRKVGRFGMKPIMWMDKAVTSIGWTAVYQAKLAEGMSEAEAIRAAQKTTLETQPSGRAKDLAQMYREGELNNWLLMFSNQLNQIWNMYTYDLPQAIKNKEGRRAAGILAGLAISGMAISFLSGWRLPDDPRDLPKETARELFRNFLSSIPVVGNNIKSGYDNQFSFRGMEVIPVTVPIGKVIGDITERDVENLGKDMVDLLQDAGVTVGVPVTAVTRSIKTIRNRNLLELLGYGFTQHSR